MRHQSPVQCFPSVLLASAVLGLGSIGGLGGCTGETESSTVVPVDADDAAMNAAMERGAETVPWFVEHWDADPARTASIKVGFPTTDDTMEYIWFSPLSYADGVFAARCGNDPVSVEGLALGDLRQIPTDDIVDWMIMEGQTWYGGYTVRVFPEMNDGTITFKDPD
ncbi:MAG: DUF2314 domain-containing protein [Phycisphaerales bacterium]